MQKDKWRFISKVLNYLLRPPLLNLISAAEMDQIAERKKSAFSV